MRGEIRSYRDLKVYQKLFKLGHEVYELTMTYPKFEMYDLGSQSRRSSNSAPANLAEGWNNKHIKIYLEGINRAMGEVQETEHHLAAALKREYLNEERYNYFFDEYQECGRMLRGLRRSLEEHASPAL